MRVVGGRLRGRALAAPKSQAIRPTADRLREALFNILVHAYGDPITGARVLDLFAGTGALGIEALSRGAAFALFVDDGAEARALLRENVATLGLGGTTRIFRRDATKLGAGASGRAVLARLPRSALRQGPRRTGAGLGARRRLADAGCADRRRGSGRSPRSRRRRVSPRSNAAPMTTPSSSCCGLLFRRDARGLDGSAPGFDLACNEALQILRGAVLRRRQCRAELAHALLHRGRRHRLEHRRVELGDDRRGVAFGQEDRVPAVGRRSP